MSGGFESFGAIGKESRANEPSLPDSGDDPVFAVDVYAASGSTHVESLLDRQTHGGSEGALITATFQCPDGRLTVSFSPMQNSLVQSSEWQIESGTGSYKGLRGGGWMVAKFEKRVGPGGETFTGTVTR